MIFVLVANIVIATISAQSLVHLPGAPPNNFKIYAGYFDVNGTDADDTESIHYMFIKAETNPETNPLVIWIVNEIGCSNYWPLFSSFGPFQINKGSSFLKINPNTWAKVANLLVFDVPGDVGYSLGKFDKIYNAEDFINVYEDLIEQFRETFPEHKNNEMYLAGSDTFGLMSFLMTDRIIQKNISSAWNLKGIIGSNIHVNWSIDYSSSLAFMYNLGYIDESEYRFIIYECCYGYLESCSIFDMTTECATFSLNVTSEVILSGVNAFDLNDPCKTQTSPGFKDYKEGKVRNPLSISHLHSYHDCYNFSDFFEYFNRKDVRNALKVSPKVGNWELCKQINYVQNLYYDTISMAKRMVDAGGRLFLFNGDSQLRSPIPPQAFSDNLGYPHVSKKKAFFVDKVLGGFLTQYQGVDVATILKGNYFYSNKGDVMLHLLRTFLNKENF